MSETKTDLGQSGDEVMRAVGDLSATVKEVAKDTCATEVDQEEVRSWVGTILKAIVSAFR